MYTNLMENNLNKGTLLALSQFRNLSCLLHAQNIIKNMQKQFITRALAWCYFITANINIYNHTDKQK